MDESPIYTTPQWPAPANVKSCVTLRLGGYSKPPYTSLNLALHVGDDSKDVLSNRLRISDELGVNKIQWLEQVHGTKLIEAADDGLVRTADGSFSSEPGQVCAVLTADCLPVLICDQAGTQVAAVHAGWRGLAEGIVTRAVGRFKAKPSELLVYLGPAISAEHFEVGIDVLEAFFESARSESHLDAISKAFSPAKLAVMKYQADIYALAKAELMALGVVQIFGGAECTFRDSEHYYSFRREAQTGRMASLIWLDDKP